LVLNTTNVRIFGQSPLNYYYGYTVVEKMVIEKKLLPPGKFQQRGQGREGCKRSPCTDVRCTSARTKHPYSSRHI